MADNGTIRPRRRDPMMWIHEQIENDANPREILKKLIPKIELPEGVDEHSLWRIIFEIISVPPRRSILPHINSITQVKNLIRDSKNIVVLTGAGVSVSCGIPDFRSRDGIYARLHKDFPDLPDPQSMFDIHYFKSNQLPFFKFAKEIYPGQFTPSLCHRFISHLDKSGRLLRNYSQNIDTLEQVAGIKNVVQCHGSFATASCMNCKKKVEAEIIKEKIFNEEIPYCSCVVEDEEKMNVLKPDIVFFGESLPEAFHEQIHNDKDKADLLIVIGSSLKVRPVCLIPSRSSCICDVPQAKDLLDPDVPQVLINREPLDHLDFDVEFYGNCDDIIAELCQQLGGDWLNVIGSFEKKILDKETLQAIFNATDNYFGDDEDDDIGECSKSSIDSADYFKLDMYDDIESDSHATEPTSNNGEETDSAGCFKLNDSEETINGDSHVAEPTSIADGEIKNSNDKAADNTVQGFSEEVIPGCKKEQSNFKSETTVNSSSICFCNALSDDKDNGGFEPQGQAMKRKCDCANETDLAAKKMKENSMLNDPEINSIDEIYYKHIPPNRYIFHGAELN